MTNEGEGFRHVSRRRQRKEPTWFSSLRPPCVGSHRWVEVFEAGVSAPASFMLGSNPAFRQLQAVAA